MADSFVPDSFVADPPIGGGVVAPAKDSFVADSFVPDQVPATAEQPYTPKGLGKIGEIGPAIMRNLEEAGRNMGAHSWSDPLGFQKMWGTAQAAGAAWPAITKGFASIPETWGRITGTKVDPATVRGFETAPDVAAFAEAGLAGAKMLWNLPKNVRNWLQARQAAQAFLKATESVPEYIGPERQLAAPLPGARPRGADPRMPTLNDPRLFTYGPYVGPQPAVRAPLEHVPPMYDPQLLEPKPVRGASQLPPYPQPSVGNLTLAAAKDFETGRSLDLGEVGRRRAAALGSTVDVSRDVPFGASTPFEVKPPLYGIKPKYQMRGPEPLGEPTYPNRRGVEFVLDKKGVPTPLNPEAAPSPQQVLEQSNTYLGSILGGLKKVFSGLPREYSIVQKNPESPVISGVERLAVDVTGKIRQYLPIQVAARGIEQVQAISAEAKAYAVFKATGDWNKAAAELPPEMRAVATYFREQLRQEQWARKVLGLDPLQDIQHPYIPHLVDNEEAVSLTTGGRPEGIRTSLGSFAEERKFPTMKAGLENGMEYRDWREASALRAHAGAELIESAKLLQELKAKGVIFSSLTDARKVGVTNPTRLRNFVPGNNEWWVRTRDEAQFLADQFNPKFLSSPYRRFQTLTTQLLRSPNLVNPAPHVVKNMFVKYVLASRNPLRLMGDVIEFKGAKDPKLLARFNKVMPFDPRGEVAPGLIHREMTKIGGNLADKGLDVLAKLNVPSSKVVFSHADPAMRYSLWKQYLSKGMSDQAAANHVWVDLVRYGTRSEIVDMWKGWPLNFFVPWRYGTIVSLTKQAANHPVRTALLIGAMDYAREVYYRKTGRWVHLPYDYVEGPVAEIVASLYNKDPLSVALLAGVTRVFGPGGDFAVAEMKNVLGALISRKPYDIDAYKLTQLFWGLAQMYDGVKEFNKFRKDGDPTHLWHLLTTAAIGDHATVGYAPKRAGSLLPESALPYDAQIKTDLTRREKLDAKEKKSADRAAARSWSNFLDWYRTQEDFRREKLNRGLGYGRR